MKTEANTLGVKERIPPYLPYSTFHNTVTSWHAALPGRIDRSVLHSYSGAIQSWMLATLRYFGLIDSDGAPTDTLARLSKAEGTERQKILQGLLTIGYPFLFNINGFDLSSASAAQFHERFKSTGAQGETLKRCMSFFTKMAKDAAMPLSPFVRTRQRRANGRKAPKKPATRTRRSEPEPETNSGAATTPFHVLYELLDPERMSDDEQQAVWTLLRYLKKGELG